MIDEVHEKEILSLVNKTIKTEGYSEKPTFSELTADTVAEFGGSWLFILLFNVFFFSWILFNEYIDSFDPAPFIGLNLIMSYLAVVQVPFLLMSQNRMSNIDRKRDMREYKLSLKLDVEIQELHDKLDLLINKI